ncbi:AMP-dependent synthetase/ligase [Penicillium malachiteum]|uniref:AMP-dependent synthetase/ligase n=1 Tax=Penicillium malachiteum TaxID=1324776 RepID=UPI0025477EB6|nr:AMP-dependent synthetase/ligase [Penicillium malachiteum]KAJ5726589.1 AMP-dependent synthetase/ligase [Penicillium malachiteum]
MDMAAPKVELFPNDPIFTGLFKSRDCVSDVVISDEYGIEADYEQIFEDIVSLRRLLRETLPARSFDDQGLLRPELGTIASITTSVYYFAICFFSVASLGGKCRIDDNILIPESNPCLIMLSSGTTGKPKGVVLPRRRIFYAPWGGSKSVELTYRPVHWISSAIPPIKNLIWGNKTICLKRGAGPDDLWEVFRDRHVTTAAITPIRLKAMQEYYYSNIQSMSAEEHDSYVAGVSRLKQVISAGSILHPDTARFWKKLTNISIITVYGTTELATRGFETSPDNPYRELCVGVTAKLSEGNKGQLFLKAPGMFTHYIGDEEATKNVFDEDGFYNTGDIVRRDGDEYFFLGRSSTDWIRFSAFTVSVVELEKRLLELPYVSEAYVLPIMDYEARELVAAVIRLKEPASAQGHSQVNLAKVRNDLSSNTEPYKLPRLLRVLQEGETIPLTVSEKARKNEIREKYFKISGYRPRDYAVPGVEFYGNETGSQFLADAKKLPLAA